MAISHWRMPTGRLRAPIRQSRLANGHLLVSDTGSWVHLTDREYEQMKANKTSHETDTLLITRGITYSPTGMDAVISNYRTKIIQSGELKVSHVLHGEDGKPVTEQAATAMISTIHTTEGLNLHLLGEGASSDELKKIIPAIRSLGIGKDLSVEKLRAHSAEITRAHEITLHIPANEYTQRIAGIVDQESIECHVFLVDGAEFPPAIPKTKNAHHLFLRIQLPLSNMDSIVAGLEKAAAHGVQRVVITLGSENQEGNEDKIVEQWTELVGHLMRISNTFMIRDSTTTELLNRMHGSQDQPNDELGSAFGRLHLLIAHTPSGQAYLTDSEGYIDEVFDLGETAQLPQDLLTHPSVRTFLNAALLRTPEEELSAFSPFFGNDPLSSYRRTGAITCRPGDARSLILRRVIEKLFEKIIAMDSFEVQAREWMEAGKAGT